MDLDNLSEREFRVIIVKMIQDLRIKMEMIQEMFTKDLKELKNKIAEEPYTGRNQQQNS